MTNCYLCGTEADIYGQDYGRRKIVRCSSCIYYEITNTALAKIQANDFPDSEKTRLTERVKEITCNEGEAEIVLDGATPIVRGKQK